MSLEEKITHITTLHLEQWERALGFYGDMSRLKQAMQHAMKEKQEFVMQKLTQNGE